jgi:hypothetical protein
MSLKPYGFVLAVPALASCSPNPRYVINAPANGASIVCTDAAGVSCNVPVDVQWDGVSVRPHPEATLDGVPLTAPFSTSGRSSVATLITGVGAHTLGVSGDLAAKGTIGTYSATSAFTVTPKPPVTPPTGGFSLSANPNALVVERGKSATTTVTVTRTAPFTGAVTVAASAPPPGLTATGAIAAGATSSPVTINATTAAAVGKMTLNLTGTSGTLTASTSVAVTIGRETGAFQEANPAPYQSTLPSTVNALAGTFRADISTGAPSLPQPRKASFFRGTQRVGNDIGFTLGPVSNLGGAGFCNNTSAAAITRGVVLSGQLPGFASQNVVMFLDMTVNSPQVVQTTADMNVQQTTGGPFILFQPRVFFSRDCTLALVAGANKLGPSKHILGMFNLINGQPIGSEVPFETATFSALVRNAAGKQEVEVKVDTGSPSAQTVVIAIP